MLETIDVLRQWMSRLRIVTTFATISSETPFCGEGNRPLIGTFFFAFIYL